MKEINELTSNQNHNYLNSILRKILSHNCTF